MINPLKDNPEKQELVKNNIDFLLNEYNSDNTKLARYLGYSSTTKYYDFLKGKDLPKNKDIFSLIASYFQISSTMLFSPDLKEWFHKNNENIFNEDFFIDVAKIVEKELTIIKHDGKFDKHLFENISNSFLEKKDILESKIKLNEFLFKLRYLAINDEDNAKAYYATILYYIGFKYLYVLLGEKYLSSFATKKANPLLLIANTIRNKELDVKTKMAIFELKCEYESLIKICLQNIKNKGSNEALISYINSLFMMFNSISDIFQNKELLDELDKNSKSQLNINISKIASSSLYNMFRNKK